MTTKYYRHADGSFVGAFIDAEPPEGAIECAVPPQHAAAKMVDGVWVEPENLNTPDSPLNDTLGQDAN